MDQLASTEQEMINVTKTYLPPMEQVVALMNEIWENRWVTNNGPLLKRLENGLEIYLDTSRPILVSNATMALQLAYRALSLEGKVITTPFSYVATTSSLVWERCDPVHVDIDPQTFNIDPKAVRDAMTPEIKAIVATHVFGNPCDIEALEAISKEYEVPLIFDAAHAFGCRYKGKSIFDHGDISICSFHGTKLFHSAEGGGIWVKNKDVEERIKLMRNFGHDGPDNFNGVGINSKMSEFHAAIGLVMLEHIDDIIARRKTQWLTYAANLERDLQILELTGDNDTYNYAYFPVILPDEEVLKRVLKVLKEANIIPRRYFYPGLNKLSYVNASYTPVCDSISARVICLPLYHEMDLAVQEKCCSLILDQL